MSLRNFDEDGAATASQWKRAKAEAERMVKAALGLAPVKVLHVVSMESILDLVAVVMKIDNRIRELEDDTNSVNGGMAEMERFVTELEHEKDVILKAVAQLEILLEVSEQAAFRLKSPYLFVQSFIEHLEQPP